VTESLHLSGHSTAVRLSGSEAKNCDRLSRLSASHFHPLNLSQIRRGVLDHRKLFSRTPRLSRRRPSPTSIHLPGLFEECPLSQHRSVSTPSAYPFPTPKCQYGRIPLPNTEVSVMDAYPFPTPKCQVRVSLPNTDVSVLGRNPFPNTGVSVLSSKDFKMPSPIRRSSNRTRAYKSFSQHPRGVSVSVLGLVSAYLYPLLTPPGAPFRGYDRSWVCSL